MDPSTVSNICLSLCSQILEQLKDKALKRAGLTEEYVLEQIEERTRARKNKEYARSDKIREELYARGIALMDEPKGTIWRPREPPESQFDSAIPEAKTPENLQTKLENATLGGPALKPAADQAALPAPPSENGLEGPNPASPAVASS